MKPDCGTVFIVLPPPMVTYNAEAFGYDMTCSAVGLLALDVRGLDDRPPFLDLGLVQSKQRLGRKLVAWIDLLSEISQLRPDVRIIERFDQSCVQLCNDRLRRSLREPKGVP